jgi:menaquinone-dependent protoporphyrinogen oxidase
MTEKTIQNADKQISRRGFIKTAGLVLGAGALACGGASWLGLKTPAGVDFPETACGSDGKRRVLVAYASKCGSTAMAADFIGQLLCAQGCAVDVRRARHVRDLSAYQAVILGSACYMEKLLDEAENFASRYLAGLSDVPVAFFSLGLTVKENTAENIQKALAYFEPLRQYVLPAAVGTFAGRIDYAALPLLYRTFARMDTEGILSAGDYRDWDAVAAWVDALPAGFQPA